MKCCFKCRNTNNLIPLYRNQKEVGKVKPYRWVCLPCFKGAQR